MILSWDFLSTIRLLLLILPLLPPYSVILISYFPSLSWGSENNFSRLLYKRVPGMQVFLRTCMSKDNLSYSDAWLFDWIGVWNLNQQSFSLRISKAFSHSLYFPIFLLRSTMSFCIWFCDSSWKLSTFSLNHPCIKVLMFHSNILS